MIHLNIDTRKWPDPEELREIIVSSKGKHWLATALLYYRNYYTNYDREPAQTQWLQSMRAVLKGTCPRRKRKGVHRLAKGKGLMGEDIYLVDGVFEHTMHVKHSVCDTYQLLHRGDHLWCAVCAKAIPKASTEVVSP